MNTAFLTFLLFIIAAALLFSSCGINGQEEQSGSDASELSFDFITTDASVEVLLSDTESSIQKQGTLRIVALGDSIPRGYGLENPTEDRFPSLMEKQLEDAYEEVDMTNYAVDGMTSSALLEQLQSGADTAVADADVVIVCIGGNNMLRYAYDIIGQNETNVIELFNAYGGFVLGDKSDTTAPDALDEYFKSINEYATSSEFTDKIEAGAALLRADIPNIVAEIRRINPDTKIYFTTIYSPYKNMNITLPYVATTLRFEDVSDNTVSLLNAAINELATQNEYEVADIYTLFKNSNKKTVNAGLDLVNMTFNFDPHPSLAGHNLIAEEYVRILSEELA